MESVKWTTQALAPRATSEFSSNRGVPIVGAAVAAVAAGLLHAAPVANALPPFPLAPACASYEYNSPAFEVLQDNNVKVSADKSGSIFNGNAGYTQVGSAAWTNGTAVGRISGRNITVDFKWNNGLTSHWDGHVDDDLIARGTATNSEGVTNFWTSQAKFTCVPPAAAAQPADTPKEIPKEDGTKPDQNPVQTPLDPDADDDNDGLKNGDEVGASSKYGNYGTNPKAADTDGDGVDDGQEVFDGTNPNDKNDHN